MAFPDILIGSKFDAKGFKQAERAVDKLGKSVKGAAGALGLALSARAAINFGKAAVKAFAEDEAAASRLAKTVDNLGLSFANAELAKFVEDLSMSSGVVDDKLRPALQGLLTTTGSVVNSQKLLKQAIDISAGSGVDLETVANDLAQAYVGNTKGLKKYNTGLTQAELKAASFEEIQKKLNEQFSGSNAAYLGTYAGKMQLLTTAAGEAKETIGGGLIEAFKILAGDTSINDLAAKMKTLATNIADFFRGLAQGFKDLAAMPVIKQMLQLAGILLKILGKVAGGVVSPFVTEGARSRSSGLAPASANSHLASLSADANAKAAAAAEKAARARARALLKAQENSTKELKKQAALKRAGTIFDLEQIQIIAALKGKLSEEDRKRLELQLALVTGNLDEAQKLTREIALAQGLGTQLAGYLASLPDAKNPFASWKAYLDLLEEQVKRITNTPITIPQPSNLPETVYTPGTYVPSSGYVPPTNTDTVPDMSASDPSAPQNQSWWRNGGFGAAQSVTVQIDGKTIADALLDQSMSGNNAYLNRRTGGFD